MVARADNEVKVTITVDNEQAMKAIAEVQEALKPFAWLGIVSELAATDDAAFWTESYNGPDSCTLCGGPFVNMKTCDHTPDCLLIRARKAVGE